MIKFFRKIRQNLLSEGKTGKYLKYAIGEIVLVVIGILIALQINNWNENRKSQILANEIYTNLLNSLEQDYIEVEQTIQLLTESLEVQRQLITDKDKFYKESINQVSLDAKAKAIISGVMSFFPKSGVYEQIISNNNMELIKSKEIKSLLINLYDFQYKRYENVDKIIDDKYHYELNELIREKIGYVATFNSKTEITLISSGDINKFNEHYDELVAECRDVYGILSTGNNYLIQIKNSISELVILIEEEQKK